MKRIWQIKQRPQLSDSSVQHLEECQARPGALRPAQREGVGRRQVLDQQQHAPGTPQLGDRRGLGQPRSGHAPVRPGRLARGTRRASLRMPARPSSTCCSRTTSPPRPGPWSWPPVATAARTACARPCSACSIAPNFSLPDDRTQGRNDRDDDSPRTAPPGPGGSTLLACGPTVPTFLARSAVALADAPKRDANGRILVVIQLDGGNDGLNTVVPYGDDVYHKSRPRLALKAKDLKPIDDHVGLHPSLDAFAKLREQGKLAIVQWVGYPNPNRSHFESMAIWQTARLHPGQEEPGWLARAIDRAPPRRRATPRRCTSPPRPCPRRFAAGGPSSRRWRRLSSSAAAWACPSATGPPTSAPRSIGSPASPGMARTRCSSSSRGAR